MDYRPDITFEYDYIRIVYEVILSKLRVNKKIIEKDLNTIVSKINNLKKKPNIPDALIVIKSLLSKLSELETKVKIYNVV